MKKKLLFFSLAVFVFGLADSAQAAVNNVVLSDIPSDYELNYQAAKTISWVHAVPVTVQPRYNISMVAGAAVSLPIATQVLCNAPASGDACAFSWKVGSLKSGRFSMGTDYQIRVCVAGVTAPECAQNGTNFRIIPPALTTQPQVLNLYKAAMGSRYANLNSGNKSGVAGVYDCIMTPTGAPPAPPITKEEVNGAKAYAMSTLAQLDWFKGQFNACAIPAGLTPRDKDGISQAMIYRYKDLCAAPWKTAINGLTKIYNAAMTKAERDRIGTRAIIGTGSATDPQTPATGQELCNFNYNRGKNDPSKVPAKNSDYNNATLRNVKLQELQNTKDQCINDKYGVLYAARVNALIAFNSGMATATEGYNDCIGLGDRVSKWW